MRKCKLHFEYIFICAIGVRQGGNVSLRHSPSVSTIWCNFSLTITGMEFQAMQTIE